MSKDIKTIAATVKQMTYDDVMSFAGIILSWAELKPLDECGASDFAEFLSNSCTDILESDNE